MPTRALTDKKIAILVQNGFVENSFVQIRNQFVLAGAKPMVLSRDHGLVNGWVNNNWGLSYPVDMVLSKSLAIDYDILFIPDGQRHADMLMANPHGRRIITTFLRENMPGVICGKVIDAMASQGMLDGYDPLAKAGELHNHKNLVMAPEGADSKAAVAYLADIVTRLETEAAA